MNKKLPIEQINELSAILKDQDLTELEVEADGFKIRVRKEQGVIVNGSAPAAAPAAPAASGGSAAPAASDPNVVEITSPMVGTFYSSSSPDADAFVKVGSKVKSGDTVCIIEAMKLFNELPSEIGGEIVEICVDDGQAVSFGQVLMKVKKS